MAWGRTATNPSSELMVAHWRMHVPLCLDELTLKDVGKIGQYLNAINHKCEPCA